jgi:transposase-like protein
MSYMNAYSEDLRKKIVEALRRGTTKSEAARSFGVSRSSVKRYAKLADEGRPLAPKKRPGSKPKMDERPPGGSWKRTWKSAPRPPSPSAASTSAGRALCR